MESESSTKESTPGRPAYHASNRLNEDPGTIVTKHEPWVDGVEADEGARNAGGRTVRCFVEFTGQ